MEDNKGYKLLDIDDLMLDKNNPRLPSSYKNSTERDIINYMLLDASLIELMLAIGKNNFFKGELLLVVYDSDKGKFRVVEGNRRLSAVKLLNDPSIADYQKSKINKVLEEAKYRPKKIPCLIFDKENEISKYLGYRHITGIKEWKLLEKARYLFNIWKNQYSNESIKNASRELAKSIGSRSDYVRRILTGFKIYEVIKDNGFYKIQGLDDTTFYFNYIADSLNKKNIAEFLGVDFDNLENKTSIEVDDENLKKWTHWFFEKTQEGRTRIIGDSSTLQKLNKVLGDEKAYEEFVNKNKTLDNALDLTEDNIHQFYSSLEKASKNLEYADNLSIKLDSKEIINVDSEIKLIKKLINRIDMTLYKGSYE